MINVRDLTTHEGIYESKAKINQLHQAIERLSNELDDQITVVRKNACELRKKLRSNLQIAPSILKSLDEIQSYTKF